MAIFDPNRWCQISVAGSFLAGNNLVGGELLSPEGTGGSVFMYVGKASFTDQQWQIFPYNSTNYVLRTHRSCPFGYLAVTYLATEPMPGYTAAATKNASITNNSMLWSIGPWGDDTPPGDCDHYLNEYNFGSFRLFFERHGDSNSAAISSPASTSSSSPSSQDMKGLSEGASAAIGASIGRRASIDHHRSYRFCLDPKKEEASYE
ncbi:hypothetical protein BKA61DRAFT_669692 [Leptodontidium sp. MPI-SDFR-AT-0119]|nr:hypothetical protein BKA61DRAFT_669692 [Leptodontidium sp. MPI-SDFR-AT-0119]